MSAYYNEFDPFAAAWLRALIAKGLLPAGEVDERSILDVGPGDLRGFTQCHFFAGIGGWPYALRLAGWGDKREVWTGSCPCQPLSVAGKQKGADDERHLWPAFHRLVVERRPAIVFGEQVAGALGHEWLAGVRADLEESGYACGAADMPACAVNAPHIRQRLYWCAVGHADNARLQRHGQFVEQHDAPRWQEPDGCFAAPSVGDMADADRQRQSQRSQFHGEPEGRLQAISARRHAGRRNIQGFWSDAIWLTGADGKARRSQPGVRLLVDGVPNRVGRLRGYGNAIVPQCAQAFIEAVMECRP